MATSGIYTWSLNRDEIILRAYQEINVYGRDESISNVSSADQSFAQYKLNAMLKTWSVDDIKVPKRRRAYLFPAIGQYSYVLGSISGSANCTYTYASTTLTTAAIAAAITLTVGSTTGMTAADNIGIELSDGTRQWTTISSVTNSTTVVLAVGLTSAASAAATIVSYTSKINKPLDILYGTTLDLKNSNNETSIQPISHDQYWHMPIKSTPGSPNNLYYDGVISGARPNSQTLYLYPQPNSVSTIVTLIVLDSIQDMTSSTDDLDLPQEWLETVVFNLAVKLAYSSGKFTELQSLKPEADRLYTLLKEATADKTPLRFRLRDY